jgi:hypothetical protein
MYGAVHPPMVRPRQGCGERSAQPMMRRKKFKLTRIELKPDEQFEALDRLAHQLILAMRKGKTRNVVELACGRLKN